MDVDGDHHEPNIQPEIESSEMQDRGGADFGFHSLLIHNNNYGAPDKSDEDSFDSDDGFCSVDDDASLFDEWEDEEDLDVWHRDGDNSDCELEEDGADDSSAPTTATTTATTTARTTATRNTTKWAVAMSTSATTAATTAAARTNATAVGAQYHQHRYQHQHQQHQLQQQLIL